MRQLQMAMIVVLLIGVLDSSKASADEPKKAENQLLGTWKLVSAKYGGEDVKFPEGSARIKHVTAIQFMWADYDKDGKWQGALGGSYSMKENKYEEVPEYGSEEVLGLTQRLALHRSQALNSLH